MSALTKKKKYTPEEYLALEEKAEYRSEYWDGIIVPLNSESPNLGGASVNHNQIVSNLIEVLSAKLKKKGCRTFANDLKIWIEKRRRFFYPDLAVICGKIEYVEDRNDTISNPIVIVEVLSDSTEAKDRGEKMLAYRTLESLQEYVLVAQDKAIVEQYTKNEDENWIHKATIGLKSIVRFESIEIELTLEEIYQRIKL